MTATRHISRALSSLRYALPLPTNTLLYFPLADQRPAYLWPVKAQHRYGAARHFLSLPKQYPETPSYCRSLLRKSVPTHLYSLPSLSFATLALANPHNALLVRFYASFRFTSCVAYQCFAIASPIDATRCFCRSLPHHAPLLLCALTRVSAC